MAARTDILDHFRHDQEASIRSILHDLVESGLLYRSGHGRKAIYRVAPESDMLMVDQGETLASEAMLVWLSIYRHSPACLSLLQEELPMDEEALQRALESLLEDGRVQVEEAEQDPIYRADSYLLPMGDELGWEVSLFDHFQAVVTSIGIKLQNGATRALPSDQIGGSTYRFDIWPGHPDEEEVRGLLSRYRDEVGALWQRVADSSELDPGPDDKQRVTFYFGQAIREQPADPEESEEAS